MLWRGVQWPRTLARALPTKFRWFGTVGKFGARILCRIPEVRKDCRPSTPPCPVGTIEEQVWGWPSERPPDRHALEDSPRQIRDDVKKQKDLKGNLDLQIGYLYGEIGDTMDEKLSRWNLAKLQHQLKFKTKNSTGLNAVGAFPVASEQAAVPPPPMIDLTALNESMERMMNAAVARGRGTTRTPPSSRGGSAGSNRAGRRIPNPRFNGCWCCGEEGHRREKCPKFDLSKRPMEVKSRGITKELTRNR